MPVSAPTITVRPATLNDVPKILDNLLDKNLEDFLRYKVNPVVHLAEHISISETYYFSFADGQPLAIIGICSGCLWMHMCKSMEEYPVASIKYIKRWFKNLKKPAPLSNYTGIEYTQAIKMAKSFGFKILRVFPNTATNTYLVEMANVWTF